MKTTRLAASTAAIFALAFLGGTYAQNQNLRYPRFDPKQYGGVGADSSFKIVRPTLFFLLRDRQQWAERDLRTTAAKMIELANRERAKAKGYDPSALDPWVENIILVEEHDYWVLSFHERANGVGVQRQPEGFVAWGPHTDVGLYYFSKEGFDLIAEPKGAISFAPADAVLREFPIRTAYPDRDVDSFVSFESAASG